MAVGDDFVIDTSGIGSLFGLDFTTPVALSYGDHPVTRKHQGVMTFFQLGRSVRFDEGSGREGGPLGYDLRGRLGRDRLERAHH